MPQRYFILKPFVPSFCGYSRKTKNRLVTAFLAVRLRRLLLDQAILADFLSRSRIGP